MGEFEFNWAHDEKTQPGFNGEIRNNTDPPEPTEVFPQDVLQYPITDFVDGLKSIDKLPKENTIKPDKPLHILQAERIVEEKSKRDQGDILNW